MVLVIQVFAAIGVIAVAAVIIGIIFFLFEGPDWEKLFFQVNGKLEEHRKATIAYNAGGDHTR